MELTIPKEKVTEHIIASALQMADMVTKDKTFVDRAIAHKDNLNAAVKVIKIHSDTAIAFKNPAACPYVPVPDATK